LSPCYYLEKNHLRILHTSDWHIGRQFHNTSLLEDQRYVLNQIVNISESEAIDVVIIAGDIYDRAIPPATAVSLVDKTLNHLCNDLNIPVILIAGNHDGADRLSFGSRQLSKGNLYITGPLLREIETVVLNDEFGEVVFYPIPYADPATVRQLYKNDHLNSECEDKDKTLDLTTHDQCMAKIIDGIKLIGQRSVAISHCFVTGGSPCESERPLSVGGAENISSKHFEKFNYTALGHLHSEQRCKENTIRYSGSILKYSFSEEHHKKSVTVVDMDDKGKCQIKLIELNARRDMRSISGAFDEVIANAKNDNNSDDYLMIDIKDKHAILDAMGKLREVYPNILHMERSGLVSSGLPKSVNRELLQKNEFSMFKDFFKQIQDQDMTADQIKVLGSILDGIHDD